MCRRLSSGSPRQPKRLIKPGGCGSTSSLPAGMCIAASRLRAWHRRGLVLAGSPLPRRSPSRQGNARSCCCRRLQNNRAHGTLGVVAYAQRHLCHRRSEIGSCTLQIPSCNNALVSILAAHCARAGQALQSMRVSCWEPDGRESPTIRPSCERQLAQPQARYRTHC